MQIAALCLLVLLSSAGTIFLANRWRRPRFGNILPDGPAPVGPRAGDSISVLTWNIGYAGLGSKADFFTDGGQSLRALSRDEIATAAGSIAAQLAANSSDVMLLQENANPGFLTRGVDLNGLLKSHLPTFKSFFWADLKTILLPGPLRFDHGMSVFTRLRDTGCRAISLPQERAFYFGFLKKFYIAVATRFEIEGSDASWVVINLHLSAYDHEGATRNAQITSLLEFAQAEYANGNHVVLGGDWNLRLIKGDAPKDQLRPWMQDFPQDLLPPGWSWAVDPNVPSVRSNHQPYVPGENAVLNIDGFLASPNVAIDHVSGIDLKFEHTDHQPVTARFSVRK